MQQFIRYLCVEDNDAWRRLICQAVDDYFRSKKRFDVPCILGQNASDGAQAYQKLIRDVFDLALLDLNLGSSGAARPESGLDVLATIAKEKRAFFVIIITGAVGDESIDAIYGEEAATVLRFGPLAEATRMFPAHRLCLINKPEGDPELGAARIRIQLESALDRYCAACRERNVFRPAPHEPAEWQIAFDGSALIQIESIPAMAMIRALLASPHYEWSVIELIQKLEASSGHETVRPDSEMCNASNGALREDLGAGELALHSQLPVSSNARRPTTDEIIENLFQSQIRETLEATFVAWIPIAGMKVLKTLPARISGILKTRGRAESLFNHDDATAELVVLRDALIRLLAKYRAAGAPNDGTTSVGRGVDNRQLVRSRQYWKRFCEHIEGYRALAPFLSHVRKTIPRGVAQRGRIGYFPPGGERFQPFWLTD